MLNEDRGFEVSCLILDKAIEDDIKNINAHVDINTDSTESLICKEKNLEFTTIMMMIKNNLLHITL